MDSLSVIPQTETRLEGEKLVIERSADVEPVLDEAKELSRAGFQVTGMGDKHAAKLPMVLVEQYCNNNGITFGEWCANPAHVKAMVNDPALAHFRIWQGRV